MEAKLWRWGLALLAIGLLSRTGIAQSAAPQASQLRSNGVLAESYGYHRGVTPLRHAGGVRHTPYRWGFPVSTYRWGWFGATHYYPRTTSHKGYYNDRWDWAYRRGY